MRHNTFFGLFAGLFLLCNFLTAEKQSPVVVFYNNAPQTVKIAFIRGNRPVIMETLKTGERYRSESGEGYLWGVYGADSKPLKSHKTTSEPMQIVYVNSPSPTDEAANARLEQIYLQEKEKAQKAEERKKIEAAKVNVTGAFEMGMHIIFQDSSHTGSEPAKWTMREGRKLANVQQEFKEVSRDDEGVLLSPGGKAQLLITKDKAMLRPSATSAWNAQLFGRGRWLERKPLLDQIRNSASQQKKAIAEKQEKERLESLRIAAEKTQKETINNSPPPFKITAGFRTSMGLFVRVRPKLWEYWGFEDFEGKHTETYRELSRNSDGLTLQSNHGTSIRIHADYWEYKTPQDTEFKMVDTDDVVGVWEPSYRSYAQLKEERGKAKIEENERIAAEIKKHRGADPAIIEKLKQKEDYKDWIAHNQRGVREDVTYYDYETLHMDRFLGIGFIQEGYNIIYMNPGRLLQNGTRKKYLIDLDVKTQPAYESFDNITILPASLSAIRVSEAISVSSSRNYMNGFEHTKSESLNVSVGVKMGGKGGKKGGDDDDDKGGSKGGAEIGYGYSKEKMNAGQLNSAVTRHETKDYVSEFIINKEHLQLHDNLRNRIMRAIQNKKGFELISYDDFEDFFLDFGTHYALRTMMGGMIWQESRMTEEYLVDQISKSETTSTDISIPIKAVNVEISSEYSTSESTKNESRTSSEDTVMYQFGADASADYMEWSVDPEETNKHEPVRVELEPVYDLIRPHLFPVTSDFEAEKIDRLRSRMQGMLQQYIYNETKGRPTIPHGKPYLLEMRVEWFKCTKASDKEFLTDGLPDVYGTISLWHNDVKRKTIWNVSEDEPLTMDTDDEAPLTDPSYSTVLLPKYVENPDGTFRVEYPETSMSILWSVRDSDNGGDTIIDVSNYTYFRDQRYGFDGGYRSKVIQFSKEGAGSFEILVSFYPHQLKVEEGIKFEPPKWISETTPFNK